MGIGSSFSLFDSSSKSKTDTSNINSGFSDLHDSSVNNLSGLTINNTAGKGIAAGATTNFSILDGGAIKEAFSFAEKSSANAYDFASDISNETSTQISKAISAVSESARSETENILINLQKYALYGALIWGAVQIIKGRK